MLGSGEIAREAAVTGAPCSLSRRLELGFSCFFLLPFPEGRMPVVADELEYFVFCLQPWFIVDKVGLKAAELFAPTHGAVE